MSRTAAFTIALVLTALPAWSQPSPAGPLARGDALGSIAWVSTTRPDLEPYEDWESSIASLGLGAGWYWTDHIKTEVEVGVTSTARFYTPNVVLVGGVAAYGTTQYAVRSRHLTIGQQYQFYRNAWFHPHVGGGVDLAWEQIRREDDPIWGYDPATRQSSVVRQGRSFEPRAGVVARAFGQAGFKAYMTQRSFFRMDFRLAFRDEIDHALVRFAVGVDF